MSKHLPDVLKAAHAHQGAAFIEIFQNCIVYNKDVFDDFAKPKGADQQQLWLQHGEPMLFGSEKTGGIKGLKLDPATLSFSVVDVPDGDAEAAGVMVHDATNRMLAHMLIELPFGEFPMPLGVIYDSPAPTYEVAVHEEKARASKGKDTSFAKLLAKGQTWTVSGTAQDPI